MARAVERLSALEVTNLTKVSTAKARWVHDGGGLYLVIDGRRPDEQTGRGTASWAYRYMMDGKARAIGLGPYPTITLAKARALALDARQKKATGRDPLAVKDAEKAARRTAAARAVTFKDVAEEYVRANRSQWKNAKHAAQWEATLKAYAYPLIGDRIIGDLDGDAVLRVLKQEIRDEGQPPRTFWEARTETANRVRQRIEAVLSYAKYRGLRDGENPASRENVKLALPAKRKVRAVESHAALPYKDMPAFIAALRSQDGMGARAFEFAILTAARTSEVLLATWGEIDLDAKRWTIPGERMKAGKTHSVPLSEPAVALLMALKPADAEASAYVFPGQRPGKPLSNMAFLMLLRRMKRDDLTAHGFRSTFRDWVSAATNFSAELAERALAHTVKDATEAAYFRDDLFEKRRALMDAWAAYSAASVGGNVTQFAKEVAA